MRGAPPGLAGWDQDWVEAGTRRTAYYSHVAPGRYRFTVLAANSDGLWNDIGASLALTVLPAWHQTAWFRALAMVALGGAALGLYRRRISRLEAQRAAQQDFSRRLIESQDAERKRIAAELHDSLGQELLLIKNRALLGLKAPEAAGHPFASGLKPVAGREIRAPMEELEEISRLTSAALQEVRDIAYNLRPYQLDQFGLTEGIEAIVRKLGSASGIQFTVEVDPIGGIFSAADENHLFRIIQEASNNIVKHSAARQARVRLRRDGRCLRVLIEDDGRGFRFRSDKATPSSSLSPSDGERVAVRGGLGLPGMAERVRILRGTMQVKSAPGQGSRLEITLPIPTHGEKKSRCCWRMIIPRFATACAWPSRPSRTCNWWARRAKAKRRCGSLASCGRTWLCSTSRCPNSAACRSPGSWSAADCPSASSSSLCTTSRTCLRRRWTPAPKVTCSRKAP